MLSKLDAGLKNLANVFVAANSLHGPIPDAIGAMVAVSGFLSGSNSLRGPIPHAVGSMVAVRTFGSYNNSLRGPVPDAVRSMTALRWLELEQNSLSSTIPHALGLVAALQLLRLADNGFRGALPHAIRSMAASILFNLKSNSLRGPIPHGVGSMSAVTYFSVSKNSLRGPIPHAVCFMTSMAEFTVSGNSLSGTVPVAASCCSNLKVLSAFDNQLSGSVPGKVMQRHFRTSVGLHYCVEIYIHCNRLTGTLPVVNNVVVLTASGNFLEGRLPSTFGSELRVLDLSGVPGRSGGFNGPLPPALRQASQLRILTMANQQLVGGIPSFSSTLSLLALHKNSLKVLPLASHYSAIGETISCDAPL